MNTTEHISDVTSETFETSVIKRSHEVPVLVDYWADWCGPCQMQMPVLQKLVDDYAGKFVLAKVNTDEQRELAKDHGIRSLPTMRLYKNGEMAEEILAAQSESTLRILLDRYIERESDRIVARAMAAWQAGEHDAALDLLRQAHQAEPDNHPLAITYAGLLVRQGSLDEASAMIAALPRDVRDEKDATRLLAQLEFASACNEAPDISTLEETLGNDPDNLEARYQLGASYVMQEQWQAALETFLEIFRRDRGFRDDAGRRGMLAVFELLGDQGELVNSYRRKLFTLMH